MKPDRRKPLSTREAIAEDARLAAERDEQRLAAEHEGAIPTERHVAQDRTDSIPIAHRPATGRADEHPAIEREERRDMLFPAEETTGYRSRWEAIQAGFVDEPRAAVEEADALVAQVVDRLSDVFTRERQALEQQLGQTNDVSTEDLRVAFKRYRAFFDRLLSV